MIRTCDPAAGAPLAAYRAHDAPDQERIVAAAVRAQSEWQATDSDERRAALHAAGNRLVTGGTASTGPAGYYVLIETPLRLIPIHGPVAVIQQVTDSPGADRQAR